MSAPYIDLDDLLAAFGLNPETVTLTGEVRRLRAELERRDAALHAAALRDAADTVVRILQGMRDERPADNYVLANELVWSVVEQLRLDACVAEGVCLLCEGEGTVDETTREEGVQKVQCPACGLVASSDSASYFDDDVPF